ncbi:MAG: 4'-phosphopantetheinyl transferase superfamily protein [Dorea sp.]|nr:4'-phosphopantetheinyl transferase superfamily protein [Dorea sp.]
MIYVFAADLSGLYEQEVYDFYYQKLPPWRKAKADRLKKEDGKVQCVGAWALWQKAQERLGLSLEESVDSEEAFLALPYVNLSHSGSYALCAVWSEPVNDTLAPRSCVTDTLAPSPCVSPCVMVGCDIEKVGPLRLNVAKRNFCPDEYEHILSAGSEEEKTRLFYRYWVLKESFIKATREGIGRAMRSFRTIWKEGEAFMVEEIKASENKELNIDQEFYYKEYRLDGDYMLAVCASSPEFSSELELGL